MAVPDIHGCVSNHSFGPSYQVSVNKYRLVVILCCLLSVFTTPSLLHPCTDGLAKLWHFVILRLGSFKYTRDWSMVGHVIFTYHSFRCMVFALYRRRCICRWPRTTRHWDTRRHTCVKRWSSLSIYIFMIRLKQSMSLWHLCSVTLDLPWTAQGRELGCDVTQQPCIWNLSIRINWCTYSLSSPRPWTVWRLSKK